MGDLDRAKTIAGAIRDPWFVVDADRRVLDYNEAFEALIRQSPKFRDDGPEGLKCYELLDLAMCRDDCIALQAIQQGGPARRDDVPGEVRGGGGEVRIQASAAPLTDLEELPAGALVVYRDVRSAARMEEAHSVAMDAELEQRRELRDKLKERTRELLAAHDDATRLEEELAAIRNGLVEPDL